MGWDAFSVPLETVWSVDDGDRLSERTGDRRWDPVVADLRQRGVTVDGLLPHGGLDVSDCGDMLYRATGVTVYGPEWSPEEVQHLAAAADWEFAVPPADQWAKENARAFLNHCAVLGRGVRFSW